MDERELVGLLYRADWTRLSLSGTVQGVNTGLYSIFTETLDKGSGRSWSSATPPPPFTPPFSPPPFSPPPEEPLSEEPLSEEPLSGDVPSAERTLLVAPGKRYREDSADGSYASGCDGKRVWQWYAQLPPAVSLRFDDRPRPPFPQLLAPSWLLTGYDLALDGEVTVCGRPCVRVLATPRERGSRGETGNRGNGWSARSVGIIPVPSLFDEAVETWDEVAAVVDAELGILLRCSRRHGAGLAEVTEFLSLTVGGEADADPARFDPPEGSVADVQAEREGGQRRRSGVGLGESLTESFGAFGRDVRESAAKTAAGMAAGGLGAAMKVTWSPPKDPFARATAEESDPDAAMPRDDPAPQNGPGPTASPVSDELLHLLYRSGAASPRLTATLHDWFDFGALLMAVPESARGAGFGGVGFLVDTFLSKARDSGLDDGHGVSRLRAGGWDRYQIDLVLPLRWIERVRSEPSGDGRTWRDRDQMRRRTRACDGTQTWEVYDDRVVTGPAEPLPVEIVEQLDASWLLTYELSDAEEVWVEGGRRGYRVVVRMPEPLPTGMNPFLNPGMADILGKWTQLFFPAVAVVDAETGWLLRLTRYKGGRAVLRQELRDIADLDSPDDFGFTPPAGLPVVDKSEESADVPPMPEGIDLGDAARGAADAVKRQLDEKVAAARGFLGSFLGGGPRLSTPRLFPWTRPSG